MALALPYLGILSLFISDTSQLQKRIYFYRFNFSFCPVFCDSPITCNGNGFCGSNGNCQCDSQHYGADCSSLHYLHPLCLNQFMKLKTYFFFSEYCHPPTTCNGHGTCQPNGECHCEPNYIGSNCISMNQGVLI